MCKQLVQSCYLERSGRDSNLQPLGCESDALTTTPPRTCQQRRFTNMAKCSVDVHVTNGQTTSRLTACISVTNLSTVDVLHRRFTEEEVHHSVVVERTHEVRICTENADVFTEESY